MPSALASTTKSARSSSPVSPSSAQPSGVRRSARTAACSRTVPPRAPEVRSEAGDEALGRHVAVDVRAHRPADRVSERGLELARRASVHRLEPAGEALRAQRRERPVEPVQALAISRHREQPRPVLLELDAGVAQAIELVERAHRHAEQRADALLEDRRAAVAREADQPAHPARIERGADHERAARVERRAQPRAQDPGRGERHAEARRHPARVATRCARAELAGLEQHDLVGDIEQRSTRRPCRPRHRR